MSYIPITEAIRRLGRSDRQIRRMVHSGKLAYKYAPDKKLLISAADVDKLSRRPLMPGDAERLDTLERELETLRQEMDTLSKRIDDLLRPQQKAASRSLQPRKRPSESDTLPAGWIPIHDLIKEHHAPRTSVMRQMQPWIKTGQWKHEGHEIRRALDPEGQAEFLRRYGNKQS